MKKLAYSKISYYYLGKYTIECWVSDDSISIRDSYLVVDDELKIEIIEDLLANFKWFAYTRTAKDILNEWKVHNAFYQRGWQKERTKHTDIELKQCRGLRFAYTIASKLFKEKK